MLRINLVFAVGPFAIVKTAAKSSSRFEVNCGYESFSRFSTFLFVPSVLPSDGGNKIMGVR